MNNKYANVYYMLNSIAPQHSILINNEIGLLGYGLDEEPTINVFSDAILESKVAIINSYRKTVYGFRGNYFLPVDSDGCILFDEYIDFVGIIQENDESVYYIFGLKNYTSNNEILEFLYDEKVEEKALVLYKNNKLYTNKFDNSTKIGELIENFSLTIIDNDAYTLNINNEIFNSHKLESNYNIYNFYRKKMNL